MASFLVLVGFMGSGKSTVGRRTAELLSWRFLDLDELFVETEGVSIADFFAAHGEAEFRAREVSLLKKVLADAEGGEPLVLALGGGVIESPEAREWLAKRGGVVFLDVDAGRAWSRAAGTGRPLAVDYESFEALLARRRGFYEAVADWVVPVENRTVEEIAAELAGLVRLAGSQWETLWGRRLRSTQRSSVIVGGPGALTTLRARSADVHREGCRLFVITDENVLEFWGERIVALLGNSPDDGLLVIPAGEASKSVSMLGRCWDWLAEQGARRDDTVVALGGGVVGDLAGFAAATFHRGVALWQIPTTLLAQVDSSIGGKTAIDLAAGKNLVGAFYQPDLVIADPETLTTLAANDYVGGLAEVVKHALLLPPPFFDHLERHAQDVLARKADALSWVVKTSVWFKAGVVEEDERERGKRAILNLGHTVAHALEVVLGYGCVTHGEAVALGLLVALALSEQQLGLDAAVRRRAEALLSRFGLPTTVTLPATDLLLSATARDKKARAGTSGFVGLRAIGEPVWGLNVSHEQLTQALEVIRQ